MTAWASGVQFENKKSRQTGNEGMLSKPRIPNQAAGTGIFVGSPASSSSFMSMTMEGHGSPSHTSLGLAQGCLYHAMQPSHSGINLRVFILLLPHQVCQLPPSFHVCFFLQHVKKHLLSTSNFSNQFAFAICLLKDCVAHFSTHRMYTLRFPKQHIFHSIHVLRHLM